MNFYIKEYISIGEILNGIEDGTVLPKSNALILSLMLHTKKTEFRENVNNLFSNYADFFPINVFTGCLNDSHSLIHSKIINYKSSKDGELANLFNQIVMLLAYSEFYANKDKWYKYFDGYENQSISNEEKHQLLEFSINDICDLLGLSHIKVVPYTYYVDGIMKDYYDTVPYNEELGKFYIEGELGSYLIHDEERARFIIFCCVAKLLIKKAKIDSKIRGLLGITESEINNYSSDKNSYYKDTKNISKALEYYYKIYTAEVKFQF